MTGRYLPPCDQLAADQRVREGAICVVRLAQQEATRHLALAVQSFECFDVGAGVAAVQEVLASRGGASASTPMSEAAAGGEDEDDAELGYSEDEVCPEVDLAAADHDSSDDGEDDSDIAMDAE